MEYTVQKLKDILLAAGYDSKRIDDYIEQVQDYGDPLEYDDEEHIRQDFETFLRHSDECIQ